MINVSADDLLVGNGSQCSSCTCCVISTLLPIDIWLLTNDLSNGLTNDIGSRAGYSLQPLVMLAQVWLVTFLVCWLFLIHFDWWCLMFLIVKLVGCVCTGFDWWCLTGLDCVGFDWQRICGELIDCGVWLDLTGGALVGFAWWCFIGIDWWCLCWFWLLCADAGGVAGGQSVPVMLTERFCFLCARTSIERCPCFCRRLETRAVSLCARRRRRLSCRW